MRKRFSINLKKRYIDIGRYRLILHKFDMEPWREQICPICTKGFSEAPKFFYESTPIHSACASTEEYSTWATHRYFGIYEQV
jgi:hypothetical protein